MFICKGRAFSAKSENGLGGRKIFSWFYVNRFSGVLAFLGEKHFFFSLKEESDPVGRNTFQCLLACGHV